MKNLTSICCLLISFISYGQNINIPDQAFLTSLIKAGIDKNNDGQIQISEAIIVKNLNLSNKNITNLTGIEEFTALEYFYCPLNKLTSIDITKNVSLKEFSCANNTITSLDVTKNTGLFLLNCGNNLLTTLDVSKNSSLGTIICNTNKITSLNLRYGVNLARLDCRFNQLTELDVSHGRVIDLDCSNNQITSLNLGNFNVPLWIDCSNNKLSYLNVAAITSLEQLYCTNNPNLSKICVNSSQLNLTITEVNHWKKDKSASWVTVCSTSSAELSNNKTPTLIHIYSILGQEITTEQLENGIYIYYYNDGTFRRIWKQESR